MARLFACAFLINLTARSLLGLPVTPQWSFWGLAYPFVERELLVG